MTETATDRYFTDSVDYPVASGNENMLGEILPFGTLWSYVSSDFASAFLNCGNLRHAVLLNRYTGMDQREEDCRFSYGAKSYPTKREAIQAWKSDPSPFHLKLSGFQDDVLIVNHLGDDAYIFVWCDCDVSDCCVGRFRTTDTPEQIESALVASAMRIAKGYGHSEDLPIVLEVGRIRGWLSF